jgi:hypothetical protein
MNIVDLPVETRVVRQFPKYIVARAICSPQGCGPEADPRAALFVLLGSYSPPSRKPKE